ncbi:MAG: CoA transferase [Gammaproteobacteria bacterium]|nr:CoA transferase [Gammaproteobacteria bacterium]MCY4200523.1 CoA transferase [Gammaproteobacteria bacterium]MCY4276629.1 CoA transferase [Gammaproteobacteria bacterium]MCY4323139.1 CoA transferase [Gammaproteobacteria bacterium]
MRPLSGIKVLDFSRVLAGPHCGRMLADLGADVVKVEPITGDVLRTSTPRRNSISAAFTHQNIGKRNISIELRDPKGLAIAHALCAKADVILENFRPGTMAKMGFDYKHLSESNPGLVFASISGYGQDGVWRDRRAYAMLVQAEMGYMEGDARYTGRELSQEPYAHGDLYAGTQCCVGILAALLQRSATGKGGTVDIDMAESILFMNESATVQASGLSESLPLPTTGSPTFQAADGQFVCVAFDPVEHGVFASYVQAMGNLKMAADPRFASRQARIENRSELLKMIDRWAQSFKSARELETHLARFGLASGVVRSVAEAARLEWANERGAFVEVSDRGDGCFKVPNTPWRFSAGQSGGGGVASYRGEDNRDVLRDWLAMSDVEISSMESEGILSYRGPSGKG